MASQKSDNNKSQLDTVSTEDLVASLKQNNTTNITLSSEPADFLAHYDIKEGTYVVAFSLLYGLYKKWALNPISPEKATVYFSKVLPKSSNGYRLNKSLSLPKTSQRGAPLKNRVYQLNHMRKFIDDCAITEGRYRVHSDDFYNYYTRWAAKIKQPKLLSAHSFHQLAKHLFKFKGFTFYECPLFLLNLAELEVTKVRREKEKQTKRKQTPRSKSKSKS